MTLVWIGATLLAAALQTARNAAQAGLVAQVGTVGATAVRFLYGLPVALLLLPLVLALTGEALPRVNALAFGFALGGALAQIAATALMLAAMAHRSFAVTTAVVKTEPVLVAVFGLLVLGDALTPLKAATVLVATAGVLVVTGVSGRRPATAAGTRGVATLRAALAGPTLLGLAAAAGFGLAAVGFRGAILALDVAGAGGGAPSFLVRATTILALGLALQSAVLLAWFLLRDRDTLRAVAAAWRPSLGAGALGALASQFWFVGFALTSAANVRTLALVEVLMAQALNRRLTGRRTSGRETAGMALIVAGVGLLLWGAARP